MFVSFQDELAALDLSTYIEEWYGDGLLHFVPIVVWNAGFREEDLLCAYELHFDASWIMSDFKFSAINNPKLLLRQDKELIYDSARPKFLSIYPLIDPSLLLFAFICRWRNRQLKTMKAIHIFKEVLFQINDKSDVEMAAQGLGVDVKDNHLLTLLCMVFFIVLVIDEYDEIVIFTLLVDSYKGQFKLDIYFWWFVGWLWLFSTVANPAELDLLHVGIVQKDANIFVILD